VFRGTRQNELYSGGSKSPTRQSQRYGDGAWSPRPFFTPQRRSQDERNRSQCFHSKRRQSHGDDCINTIRHSLDGRRAGSQFRTSGTPMSMAPLAYCLWQEFLRYDPKDPHWPNRDRFVLSAGHASMLLYSVLHLAGVKRAGKNHEILDAPAVPLDEIKRFRQLGSLCPGHPNLT